MTKVAALMLLVACAAAATAHAAETKWRTIEADNCMIHAINLSSIARSSNGGATAVTCVLDNGQCLPKNMSHLLFDCRGHYMDLDLGFSIEHIIPPRSAVGAMAEIACATRK